MSKASDPFFPRNDYTCIEINISLFIMILGSDIFLAYSGRFVTVNNVDFPVSQMNGMLTIKWEQPN